MALLVIGLIIFFAFHSISIINASWRNLIVARIGMGPWQGIYSLMSIAGFVMLIHGFGQARLHPVVLYSPPYWLQHVTLLLMIPVFPMLLAAYIPGRIQTTLKHPMLAAIKLWALAHLLSNGTLAEVLLFGTFLTWAVIDRISLKRRAVATVPAAVRGKLNDILVIVIGLALYAAFVLFIHKWLIGVPILK
jgi:uncharacterized membrane protein